MTKLEEALEIQRIALESIVAQSHEMQAAHKIAVMALQNVKELMDEHAGCQVLAG